MQTERTFVDELKYQYKSGGMHIRLIFINAIVFLGIGLTIMVENLTGTRGGPVAHFLTDVFTLQSDIKLFIYKPWGLITSIFSHFSLGHFLMNMIFLFFSGRMFLQFFTSRRLLHVYVIAGIIGGLFELLAHLVFKNVSDTAVVVGASGSIMGIFMAVAFYRPSLKVGFFGIEIPFIIFPILFLASDLLSLGSGDSVAHFAHIGGALVGILSVQNIHSSTNIINMSEKFGQRFLTFFSGLFRPKQKMRVQKGGRPVKTDEQYNMEAKERQKKTDVILDKISKSGYESLTKAEKEFLFSQSKK